MVPVVEGKGEQRSVPKCFRWNGDEHAMLRGFERYKVLGETFQSFTNNGPFPGVPPPQLANAVSFVEVTQRLDVVQDVLKRDWVFCTSLAFGKTEEVNDEPTAPCIEDIGRCHHSPDDVPRAAFMCECGLSGFRHKEITD